LTFIKNTDAIHLEIASMENGELTTGSAAEIDTIKNCQSELKIVQDNVKCSVMGHSVND